MKYFKSLFIITLAAMTIVACDSKSQEENDTNEQGTEAYESANERMSEDRMAG
jgi:outer membrane protein assembly factor BamD (BamD/ComL family)